MRQAHGWAASWRQTPLAWAFGLLLSQACRLPAHIDDDLFVSLRSEQKLFLLAAENDVTVAADASAQMGERLFELRAQRRFAAEQQKMAEVLVNTQLATDRRDGPQLKKTWALREAYLLEVIDYLRQRMRVQQTVVDCAQARFELAKAQQAQREKLARTRQVYLQRFVDQVTQYTQRRDRALAALAPRQTACERAQAAWLQQRDACVAHTLEQTDMMGGDAVSVWETW